MAIIFLFLPESAKVGIILVNKSTGEVKSQLYSTLRVTFRVGYISVRHTDLDFLPSRQFALRRKERLARILLLVRVS